MNNFILRSFGVFVNFTAIVLPKWNYNNSFKILSKVKRAGISIDGDKFLSKAVQTPFEVDGQSSVLYKWGNGSINLLFLHGWMSNSQRWLPYYEKLDLDKYTMYALDAPGHGKSTTNYLDLEMFRSSIEKAGSIIGDIDTVVCHSFSNTALTYTFLKEPDFKINKVVVMGAHSGMDAIFDYFREVLGLSERAIKILENKVNIILKVPHLQIRIKNLLNNTDHPLFVIHDLDDKITPFDPVEKAMKANPSIEKMITTGLKHDLKSEEVYNRVIQFIEK